MLRRDLVTDVLPRLEKRVGYLLPSPDRRSSPARSVRSFFQFLNGSCHGVTLLDFFQDELALI